MNTVLPTLGVATNAYPADDQDFTPDKRIGAFGITAIVALAGLTWLPLALLLTN